MSSPVCLRCGYCCTTYLKLVPKTVKSNLSSKYLNKLAHKEGFDSMNKYIDANCEGCEGRCKWLVQESAIWNGKSTHSLASCSMYTKRGSCCEDYRKYEWCNIGFKIWSDVRQQGGLIPNEILELMKVHPMNRLLGST